MPTRLIEAMQREPLSAIAAEPWIAGPLGPILERHRTAIELVRAHARARDGVVEIDLGDTAVEAANKFIAYELFPEAAYTVVVTRDPKRTKVSVGSNPWARRPARARHRAHLRALRRRRPPGGGRGQLPPGTLPEARRIAAEIASTLRGGPA